MSAKRYSGDVELRIEPRVYTQRVLYRDFNPMTMSFGRERSRTQKTLWYVASIKAPYLRKRAILSMRESGLGPNDDPRDPESYDKAAEAFLRFAMEHERDLPVELDGRGSIIVRRVFHSPCPVPRRKRK